MATSRTDDTGSVFVATLADLSVAALLIGCLIAVRQFDGSPQQFASSRPQQQPDDTGPRVTVSAPNSERRLPAPEGEPAVATTDTLTTSVSDDAAAIPDPDRVVSVPTADDGNAATVPQRPTGIIVGFEAFKPQLLPQQPPLEPELTKQPEPPPVEPEPLGQIVVGQPQPAKVEFFDTETKAASVGFVVDCSSSMDGAKFQAVCAELAKSITALKPDQQFFVVFFNNSFFPMTGNSQHPKLLPANRENKKNILTFLQSARSSGGTDPEPALQFMTGLRPEVIYLLTDGGFSPLNPSTYNNLNAAHIVIHTIGFETGGPIPILQEIASRTSGTFRPAAMNSANSGLFFADPVVVRAALADRDPNLRREAVSVALVRELPFVGDMIAMLADSEALVRSEVHDELRNLAQGSDFGPSGAGDTPDAIERWRLWWSLRKATRDKLLGHLAGDDANAIWVAASLARTSALNAPDELIAAMRAAPAPVWQELHVALVQCCDGRDFGPAPNSTAEQVIEAADRWDAWRAEERDKEARELLAKRIKLAAEKLRLARELIEVNPEAVIRRCHVLIREFADTPSAAEAKTLLDELEGNGAQ